MVIYSANVGAVAMVQRAVWVRATHRRRLVTERIDGQSVLAVTMGLTGVAVGFPHAIPVVLWSASAAELCCLIALVPTDRLPALWYARQYRPG